MTIDEAIKHCIEVAEKQEITAKSNLIEIDKIKADGILRLYDADEYESCMKCATEHRQLAEWLKELKAYREELPKEIKNAKIRQVDALEANVKTENYNSHLAEYIKGYLCGLSYTEGIIAKILEEVKTDG